MNFELKHLHANLLENIEHEYDYYVNEMLVSPPERILANSYRTSCYEDIKGLFSSTNRVWSEKQIMFMLERDSLLDDIYLLWLNVDSDDISQMEIMIEQWAMTGGVV